MVVLFFAITVDGTGNSQIVEMTNISVTSVDMITHKKNQPRRQNGKKTMCQIRRRETYQGGWSTSNSGFQHRAHTRRKPSLTFGSGRWEHPNLADHTAWAVCCSLCRPTRCCSCKTRSASTWKHVTYHTTSRQQLPCSCSSSRRTRRAHNTRRSLCHWQTNRRRPKRGWGNI